jgi:hypothetical protein
MQFDPIKALMKNVAPEVRRDDGAQKDLEEYCTRHGILGVNCGNMDPRVALQMIKGRVGDRSEAISKPQKQVLRG